MRRRKPLKIEAIIAPGDYYTTGLLNQSEIKPFNLKGALLSKTKSQG